ncbi:MAG: acyltransferase family protein [Geminicoccaceae bacterium]
MTGATRATTGTAARNGGIDALRAALTMLVVLHHTAITYGAQGSWFYQEIPPGPNRSSLVLTVFCAVNQAWFMGLFFFIAGAFTPGSLDRHGLAGFTRERLKRLGIPIVAFLLLIGPITVALARTARGEPFFATLAALAERGTYIIGPLWFVLALLIFSLLFGLWYGPGGGARTVSRARPFPSNRVLAVGALLVGTTAFLLRLVWPVGTNVLGLQLGYFASYIVLFVAGCYGARGRWISEVPADRVRVWLPITLLTIPVVPLVLLAAPSVPLLQGDPSGGWTVPAAVYAFWEPLVAWGMILWLLRLFQHRFADPGPVWRKLARRAFLIYVIHPPILVAAALSVRAIAAPPLLKFAVVGPIACLLCYTCAGLLMRIPAVQKIF